MTAPARPADLVETLVARSHSEGPLSLEQLRSAFDAADMGPSEARAVLRSLSEQGAVLGPIPDAERPSSRARRTTRASAAGPVQRTSTPQDKRPAGRTVSATAQPPHSVSTTEPVSPTGEDLSVLTETVRPSATAGASAAGISPASGPARRRG